jgi:hypothetical protein
MNNANNDVSDKVKAAIENLRKALREQFDFLDATPVLSESDIEKVVAERKQLAKILDLEKKLLDIWDEIRPYPVHFKREDWPKYRKFSIEEPSSQKNEKDKKEDLTFTLFGKNYSLTSVEKDRGFIDYNEESRYPYELILRNAEGELLLATKIFRVHVEDVMFYTTGGLIGFVPGDWLEDYLSEYEKMVVLKEKSKRDFYDKVRQKKLEDMKQNFGLE